MQIGEVIGEALLANGRPLDGVKILAAEQMQALPFATQLLAMLGAEVVKVEPPGTGESGRAGGPAVVDEDGRSVGATFLRNNLHKRSITIDLRQDRGRDLFIRLAGAFDVVAENFKPGTMARLGCGYDVLGARHPQLVYVSVSGFGNLVESPYGSWPAYAPIVEAMSGLYEGTFDRDPSQPPRLVPAGALGDIASSLFAAIGTLAALRHRDRTGQGQHVDIAMLDATVAMADIVPFMHSMGVQFGARNGRAAFGLIESFRAKDGWFVLEVVREHQFERLAAILDKKEWLADERLASPAGWGQHCDDVIRPQIEAWASTRTKLEAATELCAAGVVAGPSNTAADLLADPHVAARNMLIEVPRPDGGAPMVVVGNPVKLSGTAEGPIARWPRLGVDTTDILRAELGLGDEELAALRADGVI